MLQTLTQRPASPTCGVVYIEPGDDVRATTRAVDCWYSIGGVGLGFNFKSDKSLEHLACMEDAGLINYRIHGPTSHVFTFERGRCESVQ